MSPVAKWSLVLAAGFFAVSFVLAGVYAGHLSPRGPAPMYLLAGICAVIGVLVWRVRPEHHVEINAPRPTAAVAGAANEDADVYAMDLTKLSAAGCGLILSTGVVALFLCGIAAVVFPDLFENRRRMQPVGLVIFALMSAWFLGGKFVLKQLGLGMVRRK